MVPREPAAEGRDVPHPEHNHTERRMRRRAHRQRAVRRQVAGVLQDRVADERAVGRGTRRLDAFHDPDRPQHDHRDYDRGGMVHVQGRLRERLRLPALKTHNASCNKDTCPAHQASARCTARGTDGRTRASATGQ